MTASLKLTLLSCAVLGFRHGLDYDHIAAIADITSVPRRAWTSMRLGLAYAAGHATMIALLGALVVLFQRSLPERLDSVAERLVGLTLILLALYVMGGLVRGNSTALPPSRGALIVRGYRVLRRRFQPGHSRTDSCREQSADQISYTGALAFGIGVIHGLGAETPSQLALFLLAANLGGAPRGMAGLGMFLGGLLLMNTLMTAAASGIFQGFRPHPFALRFVAGFTAVYSFVVGWLFLLGASGNLPSLS